MPKGSLPWLLLAAILATLFFVYLEGALVSPFFDAILSSSTWQSDSLSYAASGKRMVADFVRNILMVIVVGIWVGVLISARGAVQ